VEMDATGIQVPRLLRRDLSRHLARSLALGRHKYQSE
jgi:hypothetical protein